MFGACNEVGLFWSLSITMVDFFSIVVVVVAEVVVVVDMVSSLYQRKLQPLLKGTHDSRPPRAQESVP